MSRQYNYNYELKILFSDTRKIGRYIQTVGSKQLGQL